MKTAALPQFEKNAWYRVSIQGNTLDGRIFKAENVSWDGQLSKGYHIHKVKGPYKSEMMAKRGLIEDERRESAAKIKKAAPAVKDQWIDKNVLKLSNGDGVINPISLKDLPKVAFGYDAGPKPATGPTPCNEVTLGEGGKCNLREVKSPNKWAASASTALSNKTRDRVMGVGAKGLLGDVKLPKGIIVKSKHWRQATNKIITENTYDIGKYGYETGEYVHSTKDEHVFKNRYGELVKKTKTIKEPTMAYTPPEKKHHTTNKSVKWIGDKTKLDGIKIKAPKHPKADRAKREAVFINGLLYPNGTEIEICHLDKVWFPADDLSALGMDKVANDLQTFIKEGNRILTDLEKEKSPKTKPAAKNPQDLAAQLVAIDRKYDVEVEKTWEAFHERNARRDAMAARISKEIGEAKPRSYRWVKVLAVLASLAAATGSAAYFWM
jgi:hypothetical protein